MKPIQLYSLIVNENRDYFVDYQERKSYFNSEEFISLLEQLQKTEYCEEIPPSYQYWSDGEYERAFINGNYLLQHASFHNLEDYMGTNQQCDNQISWVGYPSMDGEPVHHLSIACMIGMNSSSHNKEGAWAFLEFLLSDAVQKQKTADDLGEFPVRKDAFEHYLLNDSYWKPDDRISSRYGLPKESDIQAVRDIIKYGEYQHANDYNDPIDMILTRCSNLNLKFFLTMFISKRLLQNVDIPQDMDYLCLLFTIILKNISFYNSLFVRLTILRYCPQSC